MNVYTHKITTTIKIHPQSFLVSLCNLRPSQLLPQATTDLLFVVGGRHWCKRFGGSEAITIRNF